MPPVWDGGPYNPTITEYRMPLAQVMRACADLGETYACSEISPDRRRCTIWLPIRSPGWLVEHERLHCRGYMHYPGTTLLFDPTLPHNAARVADLLDFYRTVGQAIFHSWRPLPTGQPSIPP